MLLNGTFSLLGIQDVEVFTGGIVQRSGLRLSVQDREELHVWLVEECWLLSRRYEPQPSGITFSSWAGHKLRLRVVDWQRSRFGRTRWQFAGHTYKRERPQLVSLDADDSEHRGVGATLRGRTCAECGRSPRRGEVWSIYYADIGEAVTYCPECAEREFVEPIENE